MTVQAQPGANVPDTIASYLLPMTKALDSRGVDSAALLRRAGIEEAVSSDPLARLPYTQMGEVFRLAAESTGDPYFGLYASRYMLPAHIHALGTALLASRSLMDFCRRIERFGRFLAGTVEFYVESGKEVTRIGAHQRVPLRQEAADMFWSFVLRFMRHLDPAEFNPVRVELPISPSEAAREAYSNFFRCPLEFDCQDMVLEFDSERLMQRLPTASDELAALSDQVVQDYLARMDRDDIVARVNSLLVTNLPSGDYSKEDAAGELHISARTLQKKLQESGTTWRELVDSTRFDLARAYLESRRYSLSEIAYMLGFNDTSSFSRAFRRWSGTTPGDYRS